MDLLIPFAYTLRSYGLAITTRDILEAARALLLELHDSSLLGFYYLLRSLWVHRVSDLDKFDQLFAHFFKDVELRGLEIQQELLDWLKEARDNYPELSDEERRLFDEIDPEELERMFRERLKEQKERHDGGNKWIGTGGTSPFGHSGAARRGIRVGGAGGNRSAIRTADARAYRGYRDDLILDTRQLQLALRKLNAFVREGAEDELDLEETIRQTANNAGDLEVVVRPSRRSNLKLILIMDVGGSMDPHAVLCSRLFSAAHKSNHFKEFRTYYFHNCIYGQVFETSRFADPIAVTDLLRECGDEYKIIVVGDALMAPYELLSPGAAISYSGGRREVVESKEGLAWLADIREHFVHSVWLNPEPERFWYGNTIEYIRQVFPMYPLTLSGLGEAIKELSRVR